MMWVIVTFLVMSQLVSCKKDNPVNEDVIASFTYQVDATDFKKVAFTSTSQNYSTLSWNFGDNSSASTEANPVHTYSELSEFTVTITAVSTGGNQTDTFSEKITITDPNAELTKLVGDDTKTWKLLRDVSTGRYPLQVGPIDYSKIWWAVGLNNNELANRPCMLNDEWTFGRDGSLVFNSNGDYWGEGGIFTPDNDCYSTDNMVGVDDEDLSAWGSGNHTFRLDLGTNPKITALGRGAFIGFFKSATEYEVGKLQPNMMQDSVTYDIISLTDGNVDTLIVQANYKFEIGDPSPGGYWRYVLVHYDNPNDEPPIPNPAPTASFTITVDGLTITCSNTSELADSYSWDFGDGQTSTSQDVTYTYAEGGMYSITLTATNTAGEATASKTAFVTASQLTDADLHGSAWKVVISDHSVFVGPGLGLSDWWSVPKSFLDGSASGTDDWSCMPDDEFIFSAGGGYEYKTNGSARNDGYFGGTNGCISDAEIAASGNGAAFGSGIHSYEFIPSNGVDRAKIILTNGGDKAAFLGFYKGYYGGENSDGANSPNGGNTTNTYEVMGYAKNATKEYLFVSVDTSGDHTGATAWSMVLER